MNRPLAALGLTGFLLLALGGLAWAVGYERQQTLPSSEALTAWLSGENYVQPPSPLIVAGIGGVIVGGICVLAWLIILAARGTPKRDA